MNKTISTSICFILLLNMAGFTLVGCRIESPAITLIPQSTTVVPLTIIPTQPSPTVAPAYIHFSSTKEFKIYLEFDYPGSWFIRERREAGATGIFLLDPRFRTLPLPSPSDYHPTPNDFGRVDIWVIPMEPDHTLVTQVEAHKNSYIDTSWITPLGEYKITIDGYEAYVFEDQIDFPELYTSLMFERNLFFAVKDQIYQITFRIAEKDRGDEFEKGYEHFFKSLKVVP